MSSDNPNKQHLRLLPAVERVLNLPAVVKYCAEFGRSTVTDWVREVLGEMRNGQFGELATDAAGVEGQVVDRLDSVVKNATSQRLRKVINGTGIVIHTNLGRAPLAAAAIDAMNEAARCTNVEVDLETGQRGRRGAILERLCQEVTGAEAALVVNNCAAATLLTLQTLAAGRRVVISRGQLIEIGGSFRLPDVFRQAGVTLHEVGTTNRTRLADYSAAIGPETAALLRVHPSNYRVAGFVESVSTGELVILGRKHQLPVIDDLGSGCLYHLAHLGLPDEPVVSESLQAGADLVLFSGDKLLGGPQCGIIVGRAELVSRLRSNPLARALRVDKLTLAALQGTLEIHRAGRAFEEIPVLQQLALSADEIRARVERIVDRLRSQPNTSDTFSAQTVASAPGGGALPEQTIPSFAIAVACSNPDEVAKRLRTSEPAVFGRVQDDRLLIDLRTVMPEEDEIVYEQLLQRLKLHHGHE